ncbi:hypothetical protein HDV00_011729 [Rhizophlyctis rosea]|nr:hypothetical protein HDV00_011729 [Rhizophlyctis rosea]
MKSLDDLLPDVDACPPPHGNSTIRTDISVSGANVFAIDDFLSDEECEYFKNLAERLGFESVEWEYAKDYRDCVRVVGKSETLSNTLWSRILPHLRRSDLLARPYGFGASKGVWVPKGVNPCIRFTKYTSGGHFSPHRDGGFVITDSYRSVYTLLIYLNDDFKGGKTRFHPDDEEGMTATVDPKRGTAIVFNHDVKHEGQAMEDGAKYIIRTDIMFERVDLDLPGTGADAAYTSHPRYKEAERLYNRSIELQQQGDPRGSTEAYLKAMEIHATLPSILPQLVTGNKALDVLPLELWTKILLYFQPKTLAVLSRVNAKFCQIARDPFVWSALYKSRFPEHHAAVASSIRAKLSLIQTGTVTSMMGDENIALAWDWYSLYKHRATAEKFFQPVFFDVGSRYTKFGGLGMDVLKKPGSWWEYEVTSSDEDSDEDTPSAPRRTRKRGPDTVPVGHIRSVFVRQSGHYWSAGSGYCDVTVHGAGREVEYDHTQRIESEREYWRQRTEQFSFQPYRLDWQEGERRNWVAEGEVDPTTFETIVHFVMQKSFRHRWMSPSSHPFIFALPPFLSPPAHRALISIIVKLHIPYMALIDAAVLSLLPHALSTAVVVSIGASHVWVAPIDKCKPVYKYPLPVFRIPNKTGWLKRLPEADLEALFFTEPVNTTTPPKSVDLLTLITSALSLLPSTPKPPPILLTGGQAPYIHALLKRHLPTNQIILSAKPDEDIVRGAEVFASLPGARSAYVNLETYNKIMGDDGKKERDRTYDLYWYSEQKQKDVVLEEYMRERGYE